MIRIVPRLLQNYVRNLTQGFLNIISYSPPPLVFQWKWQIFWQNVILFLDLKKKERERWSSFAYCSCVPFFLVETAYFDKCTLPIFFLKSEHYSSEDGSVDKKILCAFFFPCFYFFNYKDIFILYISKFLTSSMLITEYYSSIGRALHY